MEGGEEVKCYCLEGDSFSFFCLLAPLDSASDPLGLCLTKKLSTVICFCLCFDGLRVLNSRHSPRRFVFGKFVRKPNCSRSTAFVNQGLTVVVFWVSTLGSSGLSDISQKCTATILWLNKCGSQVDA